MEEFILILFIAFVVLQIILFFKIWAMTNNVSEIKNILSRETQVKHLFLQGKIDDAESAIICDATNKLYTICVRIIGMGEMTPNFTQAQNDLKKDGDAVIEKLKAALTVIGRADRIPDNLSSFDKFIESYNQAQKLTL